MVVNAPSALSSRERDELASLARGKTVLEMGAQYGGSTILLAGVASHVTTVDWFRGDQFAGWDRTEVRFWSNLAAARVTNVTTHVGRFEQIVPTLPDLYDLVFVDGEHTEEATTRDVALALRQVKIEGVIAVHDCDTFPGVRPGIEAAIQNWSWEIVRVVDSLAIIERIDAQAS